MSFYKHPYYGRDGSPITRDEWLAAHESQEDWERARRVAEDQVGEVWISTVWLGLDHAFGYGPPLIFETMCFGGSMDQEAYRYSTESEALAGHAEIVSLVRQQELAAAGAEASTEPPKAAG